MRAAGVLAINAALSPGSAAAQAVWRGNLFVTSLSPACFDFLHRRGSAEPRAATNRREKEALLLIAPNYAILIGAKGHTLGGGATIVDIVIDAGSEFLEASESADLTIAPAKISKLTSIGGHVGTLHNLFLTDVGFEVGVGGVLGYVARRLA